MNDPVVKVALVISILIGAVFIAIVFRPVFSAPPGPNPPDNLKAVLSLQHQQMLKPNSVQENGALISAEQKTTSASTASQNPTVLAPFEQSQSVPDLPPRYPGASAKNGARWGMPMDMMPIVARPAEGPKLHKIVDGDKLDDLAARYLGSTNRAMEIFDANRDVLTNPGELPIGAELKIPARK